MATQGNTWDGLLGPVEKGHGQCRSNPEAPFPQAQLRGRVLELLHLFPKNSKGEGLSMLWELDRGSGGPSQSCTHRGRGRATSKREYPHQRHKTAGRREKDEPVCLSRILAAAAAAILTPTTHCPVGEKNPKITWPPRLPRKQCPEGRAQRRFLVAGFRLL